MQKNPYISLLNLMEQVSRSSNSPDIQIGQILSSPPDIKVRYNGIILTKEELWISHYLLAGYGRTAKGHIVSATQNRAGGSGDAAYQSHNHDIDNDYTDSIIYTDTLKPGMYVAIMPMLINGRIQQYIILDEIVRIDGHG
ncbi:MAG: DUF2577 domain-containing protein [Megasphaera elsdenii]|nr:DUF2577 domain-containing protein [Megasphaera elsdenii]